METARLSTSASFGVRSVSTSAHFPIPHSTQTGRQALLWHSVISTPNPVSPLDPKRLPELVIPSGSLEMGTLMCYFLRMGIHSGRCHRRSSASQGCVSSSLCEEAELTQGSDFQQVPKAAAQACHWGQANAAFVPADSHTLTLLP